MRIRSAVATAWTTGMAIATAAALLGPVGTAQATPSANGLAHRSHHRVCAEAPVGYASCLVEVQTDSSGTPLATTAPYGLRPVDIRAAYALTAATSGHRTVAIVNAYNDPTAESDLAVYRRTFGLPVCSTANGCFHKVNQSGGTTMPATNGGWAQEISLDVDMISATCPDCKILLVEASSSSFTNLAAGVNYAASRGVAAISNSYGGTDSVSNRTAYNHPGIAITASSGDAGYGVSAPASFGTVISVGGTSLRKAANTRGWTETAWSGAGSGCSAQNTRPSWQNSTTTKCATRALTDVSAVADPQTPVAVYDTTLSGTAATGWVGAGGTSASSPIIASVYAMSKNTAGYPASYTWAHRTLLNDVVSGSNGSCATTIWCHAAAGWDGPTGLGTPRGIGAF